MILTVGDVIDTIRDVKNIQIDLDTFGEPLTQPQKDLLEKANDTLSDYITMLRSLKVVKPT